MGVYPWKDQLVCSVCKKTFPLKAPYVDMIDHTASHSRRPPEMIDCVLMRCENKECSFDGRDSGSDVYEIDDRIVVEWHADSPMCEHMWEQAKAYIDFELKSQKGQLPPEEMLRWWCPYCTTRIPRTSERCPNCGSDLSKLLTPVHKAAAAQLERVYKMLRKDKNAKA